MISIKDLSYTYGNGTRALDKISLDLAPGSITALMGSNGAGKTTLAKQLNGLLKPGQGRVMIGGSDTRDLATHNLAAKTAYLFQNPDDQLFSKTIGDEIAFGPVNLGYTPERTKVLVHESLTLTGLTPLAKKKPADLSLGQKRLCCLAAVIAMDADCYVLDEPTQGLDGNDTRRVEKIISHLSGKKKTMIIITHDLDFAAEQTRDGIVLHQGRLVAHHPLARIFSNPDQCREWGLYIPQMTRLGRAMDMAPLPLTPAGFLTELTRCPADLLTHVRKNTHEKK